MKYYTPEISDLFIGYECEVNPSKGYENQFHKVIIGYKEPEGAYTTELSDLVIMMDDGYGEIRTKYLDKEDIESCGFECIDRFNFKRGDIHLNYNNLFLVGEDGFIVLSITGNYLKEDLQTIHYYGRCKSINEFKKLLNWLNIK